MKIRLYPRRVFANGQFQTILVVSSSSRSVEIAFRRSDNSLHPRFETFFKDALREVKYPFDDDSFRIIRDGVVNATSGVTAA